MPRALAQQFADGSYTEEMLAIERQHDEMDFKIEADTAATLWDGGVCDYDMAVEGLMLIAPSPAGGDDYMDVVSREKQEARAEGLG
jgi:hypothetical protein